MDFFAQWTHINCSGKRVFGWLGGGGGVANTNDFFSLSFSKNSFIFAAVIQNINITMALPIKPPPTLTGKAAEEFYERAANMKETKTKEEVQESMRKTLAFLAEQDLTNPYKPWKLI